MPQVVDHPVHLVELPLGVLVLHPQLVAVGLADGAALVGPLVPDMAVELVDVVGLLLPDPQQLVHGGLPKSPPQGEDGKLLLQVIAVDDPELLHRVGGGPILPAGADGLVGVPDPVIQDVAAVLKEDLVGVTYSNSLLTSNL